jgi:hypothetical protein
VTLKIYDKQSEKEFEDHVVSNQFQVSTFLFFCSINALNLWTQIQNYLQGTGVLILLIAGLVTIVFTGIWWILFYYKRLTKYSGYLWAVWFFLISVINMISVNLESVNGYAFQDPMLQMMVYYILYVLNLTYCQFKQIVCWASPLYFLAFIVQETTWQNAKAKEINALLPDQYKTFIVPQFTRNVVRVLGIILSAIIAKYHHQFQVITLILQK